MTDLWPNFSFEEMEENKAVDILREQARALEKKTNKKVNATFSKIEYKENANAITSQIGKMIASISSPERDEILDEELKEKRDVNEFYKTTKYKFEIYNDTYRFRVFVLYNRMVFPINLDVDEGIKSELQDDISAEIKSNAELQNLLASIFSSQKLRTVITQMMKNTTK